MFHNPVICCIHVMCVCVCVCGGGGGGGGGGGEGRGEKGTVGKRDSGRDNWRVREGGREEVGA